MENKEGQKIVQLLDNEFLNKLVEIGRIYGWSGDYTEIGKFILYLHQIAGINISHKDIEPYEEDEWN